MLRWCRRIGEPESSKLYFPDKMRKGLPLAEANCWISLIRLLLYRSPAGRTPGVFCFSLEQ
jgi:hypothetical protein